MAISFVAAATPTSTFGPGTTPLTLTVPGSPIQNDFMFMFSARTGTAGAGEYGTPAGWTEIPEFELSTTVTSRNCWGGYKFAGASEPANYTIATADPADEAWGGLIVVWRGVHTSNPLDTTPVGDISQGDVNNGDPPAITTVTADSWVVAFNYIRSGGGSDPTGFTPPSGFTERVDFINSNFRFSLADMLLATPGPANPGVFLSGGVLDTNDHILGTFALRPAPTGGGGPPSGFVTLINGGLIK